MERERCENQILQFFLTRVGLEPAIPDKQGRRARHPAIGDSKSIARPQSSQLGLSDTMHGYMERERKRERERERERRGERERGER